MSELFALIFAFLTAAFCFGIMLFCVAWVTILPTIGLLWWTGALQ